VLKNSFEPIAFYKGMKDTSPSTSPSEFVPGEEDPSMMMMGGTKKR